METGASRELEDVERMLAACEDLFGPYRWDRYDVLILPPSFPFGGMENPCLTFATPTILAGDKLVREATLGWVSGTRATLRNTGSIRVMRLSILPCRIPP